MPTPLTKIETLVYTLTTSLLNGHTNITLTFIRQTPPNTHIHPQTSALHFGPQTTTRPLTPPHAPSIARLLAVLSTIHTLLRTNRRISQRELYYLLRAHFHSQAQLNDTVLSVSALLAVPRAALHVGAASRGVLAGCVQIAAPNSLSCVDARYVGANGWPVPGDLSVVCSLLVHSTARYLVVIEKFGVFSRLVQDRFFDSLPCILLCGKGYPSVATRAMVTLLQTRLRLVVVGVADFNPHGLALLQCYRTGSVRSAIEGANFVCNLHWLGLRSSHIHHNINIGPSGHPLTQREQTLLTNLQNRHELLQSPAYAHEIAQMTHLGKVELQWLYGHVNGTKYLSEWLTEAILRRDYI